MDTEQYNTCRDLYYQRKSLPFHHPNCIFDMSDWLKVYQMEDVDPLVEAVKNQFAKFWELFRIDANVHVSLPSMAMAAMFSNYDSSLPLCYSFHEKFDAERVQLRENMIGGLTVVGGRHVDLTGGTDSPHNARHVANGDPITALVFHDFNG